MADESLVVGNGLEVLKKIPEMLPSHISNGWLLLIMFVLAIAALWAIGKLFYLAMK